MLDVLPGQLTGVVRDAMSRDVKCIRATATVGEVAFEMCKHGLRRIVLIDDAQRVVGVISQRDLLRHFLEAQEATDPTADTTPELTPVACLLTRNKPITVLPDLPLVKAALVLATNKIGCLPTVGQRGELLGMLTITDLLRRITGQAEERLESMFQFYTPSNEARVRLPAYIRKASCDIVVPLKSIDRRDMVAPWAQLGYDDATGRILIKFTPEGRKDDGALPTRTADDCLIIAAREFVNHFHLLGKAAAFDVTVAKDPRFLVLTPR